MAGSLVRASRLNSRVETQSSTSPATNTRVTPSLETREPAQGEVSRVARWITPNTGSNWLGVAPRPLASAGKKGSWMLVTNQRRALTALTN